MQSRYPQRFQFSIVINGPGIPGEHWHLRAIDDGYTIPLEAHHTPEQVPIICCGDLTEIIAGNMGASVALEELTQHLGAHGCGLGGRCDVILNDEMMAYPGRGQTNFIYGPYDGLSQQSMGPKEAITFAHLAPMKKPVALQIKHIEARDESGPYQNHNHLSKFLKNQKLGTEEDIYVCTFTGHFDKGSNGNASLALMRTVCQYNKDGKRHDEAGTSFLDHENRFSIEPDGSVYRYPVYAPKKKEKLETLPGVYHLHFWQKIVPDSPVYVQPIEGTVRL